MCASTSRTGEETRTRLLRAPSRSPPFVAARPPVLFSTTARIPVTIMRCSIPLLRKRPQVFTLDDLARIIAARADAGAESSYTASLLAKGPPRCAKKFGEEAVELAIAAVGAGRGGGARRGRGRALPPAGPAAVARRGARRRDGRARAPHRAERSGRKGVATRVTRPGPAFPDFFAAEAEAERLNGRDAARPSARRASPRTIATSPATNGRSCAPTPS